MRNIALIQIISHTKPERLIFKGGFAMFKVLELDTLVTLIVFFLK